VAGGIEEAKAAAGLADLPGSGGALGFVPAQQGADIDDGKTSG
jgi:hypothetical protein